MMEEIADYVRKDPEHSYRIYIGTDSKISKINGMVDVEFVTAVVIARVGHGGRYFWTKQTQKCSSYWRNRIYMETFISLNWTENLIPALEIAVPENTFDLEIHIDVGENGPTRAVINEMVGMVVGSGYKAKTKPESYAASIVADKYT